MSSFFCEHCGVVCSDTPRGYVTVCEHYPADSDSGRRMMAKEAIAWLNTPNGAGYLEDLIDAEADV